MCSPVSGQLLLLARPSDSQAASASQAQAQMADAIYRAVVLTKHKRDEQKQLEEGRTVKRSSGKNTG